jgi:hypothetical protein
VAYSFLVIIVLFLNAIAFSGVRELAPALDC